MSDTTPNSPAILNPVPPPRANCRIFIFDTASTRAVSGTTLVCMMGPSGLDPEIADPRLDGGSNLRRLIMPAVLLPVDYESSNPSDEVLSSALRVTNAVLAVCGIVAPAPAPDAPAGLPEP